MIPCAKCELQSDENARIKTAKVDQPMIVEVKVLAETEEQAIESAEQYVARTNKSDPDSAIFHAINVNKDDMYWVEIELDSFR